MARRTLVPTAIIAAAGLTCHASAQPAYSIKKLEPLPGDGGSTAAAINNSAEVAGTSLGSMETPYFWSAGTMAALPVTGAGPTNTGLGINSSGTVVGMASFPTMNDQAALWTRDNSGAWSVENLGNLPGFVWSRAWDIADGGTLAVGEVDDAHELSIAVAFDYNADQDPPRWDVVPMGTLPGYYGSIAHTVNSLGVAAGYSYNPYSTYRATRWTLGATTWFVEPLALLPGGSLPSEASDINEDGDITGSARGGDGLDHAVVWSNDAIIDLGTYPGEDTYAKAINGEGDVVGETWGFGLERAFLAHGGQIHDLNDLIPPATGWDLKSARDINDKGQIVGEGHLGGLRHSFLLTPVAGVLQGPQPGIAGVVNSFSIDIDADSTVYLFYAYATGETALPGCDEVPLNLDNPAVLAAIPSSGTVSVELPDSFSGQTVYFQAAAPAECAVSDVVEHTFP